MDIHIGLNDQQRQDIAHGLNVLLADSYSLYIKTHNFHWNVEGPHFTSLHTLFEKHYMELAEAIDQIAERIRALGEYVEASYQQFAKLTSIKDEIGHPDSREMLKQLIEGQEQVVRTARHLLQTVEDANDQPSLDLLTERMYQHEKNAWMLRSLLEK